MPWNGRAISGFVLVIIVVVGVDWHALQLDDKPIQHREVMNNESDLFKSYFKTIKLMEGGYVCVCLMLYVWKEVCVMLYTVVVRMEGVCMCDVVYSSCT